MCSVKDTVGNVKLLRRADLYSLVLLATMGLNVTSGQVSSRKDGSNEPTKLDFSLCYDFSIKTGSLDILLRVNVPKTIPGRQKIVEIEYSRQPSRIFSKNGNDYAEFLFRKAQEKVSVEVRIKAELLRYDLATAEENPVRYPCDAQSLRAFLKSERMIEKNHREIKTIAAGIEGETETEIVENIYEYVIGNMEPDLSPIKGSGALQATRKKTGMCIDYCDLFVALCRARGIPARVVGGYKTQFSFCPKHSWVEVYFGKYGWVPFDVTYGEGMSQVEREYRFRNLKPMYIAFTCIRNDEVLHNCYTYCAAFSGNVESDHSVVFRQPLKLTYRGP